MTLKPAAVAAALRTDILDGRLPPAARLLERELIERFGVARHSLRAALRLLEAEGLVQIEPHRGASVAAFDVDALRGLLELRAALQLEAAQLALEREPELLAHELGRSAAALRAVCERPRPAWQAVVEAHAVVHRAIVLAARSPRIAAAYTAIENELRLLVVARAPACSPERMAAHHDALARTLPREGPDALRRHLSEGIASVLGAATDRDAQEAVGPY